MINDALLSGAAGDVNSPAAGLPVTEVVKSLDIKKDATIPQPLPTDKEINITDSEGIKFVSGESLELIKGEVKTIEIVSEPAMSNLPPLVYESSNLRVARFIEDGRLMGCCPGSSIITVTATIPEDNSIFCKINVTVVDPNAPKTKKGKK